MTDIVLRGGTVVDGTGTPGRTADVVISGGRIVAIGPPELAGPRSPLQARVLDVSGTVVCPGFVDLHSHTDFTIASAPGAITQARQGVTTLVTGNCGFSPFPVVPEHEAEIRSHAGFLTDGLTWEWSTAGEYAGWAERLGLGVNLVLQVGQHALRIAAMGAEDRAPTAAELARMRALLADSALDGVVGFSTGLIYAPGSYASPTEITALAAEAARFGMLYSTHIRDEGAGLLSAVDEALAVARATGVRLEISHLKSAGEPNWGRVSEALAAIEAARSEGLDVAADVYPYTASSTTLTAWLPGWALAGGTPELLARLENPDTRARIVAGIASSARDLKPDAIVLASTGPGPYAGAVGRSIADVARDLGVSPATAIVDVLAAQGGSVDVVHHAMAEFDVRTVLSRAYVSVASDSATPGCPGHGTPHPRGLGTFARVLGRYARDQPLLTFPEAVRRMTSLPAARLRWSERGVLRPGAVADLTVIEPDRVIDTATYADPWHCAVGVRHTMIAGTFVLEDTEPTGARPGRVLRSAPGR